MPSPVLHLLKFNRLQSWWADRIPQGTLQDLAPSGTAHDQLRFSIQTSNDFGGGWMLIISSSQQLTCMPGPDYRLALHW